MLAVAVACGSSSDSSFDDNGSSGGLGFGDGGGDGSQHLCVNLECQQKQCPGGADTSVTGTVYAPNGTLPLYNAIVYVPNAPVQKFTKGATCDKCGAVSGNPVTTALTDSHGNFTLHNVPSGDNIPLVVQVGKWRRQTTIKNVAECTQTKITDPNLTRLPKNQTEGDIPQIALTTGGCDKLGCMLPKVGIDASEFGKDTDGASKAIHVYLGRDSNNFGTGIAGGPNGSPLAETLWTDINKLKQYDMAILSCECAEHLENKGGSPSGPPFSVITDYLSAGGRIFTTDFMYVWYRYTPDATFKSAENWRGGAPPAGSPITLDTGFPKGQALKEWMDLVIPGSNGKITPDIVWGNIISLDPAKTQQWAESGGAGAIPAGPRVFTVNLPAGQPADQQCGKGVHIDAHLNQAPPDTVDTGYPASCNSPLKPGEKLLAFFFYDLAACIQNDNSAPQPPQVN
jgi:hypothetical protein